MDFFIRFGASFPTLETQSCGRRSRSSPRPWLANYAVNQLQPSPSPARIDYVGDHPTTQPVVIYRYTHFPITLSVLNLCIPPPYIPQTLLPVTQPTYTTLPTVILVNVNLLALSALLFRLSVNCGMLDHPYIIRSKKWFPPSNEKPQEESTTILAWNLNTKGRLIVLFHWP